MQVQFFLEHSVYVGTGNISVLYFAAKMWPVPQPSLIWQAVSLTALCSSWMRIVICLLCVTVGRWVANGNKRVQRREGCFPGELYTETVVFDDDSTEAVRSH